MGALQTDRGHGDNTVISQIVKYVASMHYRPNLRFLRRNGCLLSLTQERGLPIGPTLWRRVYVSGKRTKTAATSSTTSWSSCPCSRPLQTRPCENGELQKSVMPLVPDEKCRPPDGFLRRKQLTVTNQSRPRTRIVCDPTNVATQGFLRSGFVKCQG